MWNYLNLGNGSRSFSVQKWDAILYESAGESHGICIITLPQNDMPLFLCSLEVLVFFKLSFIICNDTNLFSLECEWHTLSNYCLEIHSVSRTLMQKDYHLHDWSCDFNNVIVNYNSTVSLFLVLINSFSHLVHSIYFMPATCTTKGWLHSDGRPRGRARHRLRRSLGRALRSWGCLFVKFPCWPHLNRL